MKFYSTKNPSAQFSFSESVLSGLAPDGGLFLPDSIPNFSDAIAALDKLSPHQRIAKLLSPFAEDEIPEADFLSIVEEVFNFPIAIKTFDQAFSVLELFHGPTLAFKDFGARFLARVLGYFVRDMKKKCVILVATSGDTGSAVANAFHGIEGIQVVLLYPQGKVSKIQEQQLTTFDKNITALEIEGAFDDCQRLVKTAFMDTSLTSEFFMTSANSINIARLLPQMVYYFEAFFRLRKKFSHLNYSVPCGNLGNISAGLLAREILGTNATFTASLNQNSVFEEFLLSGEFTPRQSLETISNAMDVGNPSNLERIRTLFPISEELREIVNAYHFDDKQTLKAMKEFHEVYHYVLDPHTAVSYLGAKCSRADGLLSHQVIVSTAHPAKFGDVVKKALNINPEIPERLAAVLDKQKQATLTRADYDSFKDQLLKIIS